METYSKLIMGSRNLLHVDYVHNYILVIKYAQPVASKLNRHVAYVQTGSLLMNGKIQQKLNTNTHTVTI